MVLRRRKVQRSLLEPFENYLDLVFFSFALFAHLFALLIYVEYQELSACKIVVLDIAFFDIKIKYRGCMMT